LGIPCDCGAELLRLLGATVLQPDHVDLEVPRSLEDVSGQILNRLEGYLELVRGLVSAHFLKLIGTDPLETKLALLLVCRHVRDARVRSIKD
jgi:hypothetical protein